MRADAALHALLGISRFPIDDTVRNLFKRFGQKQCQHFSLVCGTGSLHDCRNAPRDNSLDLDSMVFERYGYQQGALRGPHPRRNGYAVGEFSLQLFGWDRSRRCVVIREQLRAERPALGRRLLEVPGYTFHVFVTNLVLLPEEIWRDYNHRSDMENRIAELKHDLAADGFLFREFFATEAFRSILLLFNLLGKFQRAAGLASYRQPATLRTQVFCRTLLVARATVWSSICRLFGAACNGASRCWKMS